MENEQNTGSYDAGIEVLDGLAGLRQRRSMYIGSTGVLSPNHAPHALTQLAQEIMSNSLDERVEGHGDKINVTIHEDGAMSIQDFGRGMPKGPGAEFDDVINGATVPHASGKFDASNYKKSGIAGMNGIGVKVTNATSKYLSIHAITPRKEIKDGKKYDAGGLVEYYIEFNQERVVKKEILNEWKTARPVGDSQTVFKVRGSNKIINTGTTVKFLPDDGPVSEKVKQKVFESTVWTNNDLFKRFESAAFLNAGLEINMVDLRTKEINEAGEQVRIERKWLYENGLADYVKVLAKNETITPGLKDPLVIEGSTVTKDGHEFYLHAAMLFIEDIDTDIVSFANGVPTKSGGPHVDGFTLALTRTMNDYGKSQKLLKGASLKQGDVLEGLIATFELKIPGEIAEFDGQTKEKLSTAQAREATMSIVEEQVTSWLYDHPKQAENIISKMLDAKKAREAAQKAKTEAKSARKTKGGAKLALASKLKAASSRKPEEKEMYITEGDSASNIQRDTKTQAIFPIRGKILNVFESNLSDALSNSEISTITATMGAGIGQTFALEDMQYHKIIIAADADVDGAHIRTLLMGLFFKFFKPLVEAGYLYVVEAPLYRAMKYIKGQPHVKMYYTQKEIDADRDNLKGYEIQRYKGLGEMNKDEAYDAITNRATHRLVQVSVDDMEETQRILKILLGKDASLRRTWINEYVDFNERAEAIK